MDQLLRNPDYQLRHVDPETGFGLLYSPSRADCVFLNPLATALWKAPLADVVPEREAQAFDQVFGFPGGAGYLKDIIRDMAARGVLVPSGGGAQAPAGPVSAERGTPGPAEPGLAVPPAHGDGGLPPLEQVYFYATRECNARCYHCYQPTFTVKEGPHEPAAGQLEAPAFLAFLEKALPLGVRAVKITGGEPLLRADLPSLVSGIRALGLEISMETNGYLLDERLADFLAKNEVGVSVSLDGGSSGVHDSLRGLAGSFERATSALKMMSDRGREPTAIMAVSKRNISEVDGVLRAARAAGCLRVKFNPVNSLGIAHRLQKTRVLLEVEEIMDLYAKRAELEERHDVFLFLEGPPSFATVFEIVSGHSAVCPFTKILGILANGSISFCGVGNSCPELIFGDITKPGFDIELFWRTAEPLVASRQIVSGRLDGICRECILAPYCKGSCRALAYGELGSFASPHPFCQAAYERGRFPAHYLAGGDGFGRH